jgi:hypothetical protein
MASTLLYSGIALALVALTAAVAWLWIRVSHLEAEIQSYRELLKLEMDHAHASRVEVLSMLGEIVVARASRPKAEA